MIINKVTLTAILAFVAVVAAADDTRTVRVLVWDEQQPEQAEAYPTFLGEAIAEHLNGCPNIRAIAVHPAMPHQGLDAATLDATDVIVWWGHRRHGEVKNERAEEVVQRVLDGRLGFVALHSSHFAQPFMRLMHERAKVDARTQVSEAELSTAPFDFSMPLKRAMVKRDAKLTPSLDKVKGAWKLTPPACVFPAWRADGEPSHVRTLLPEHPIAKGLPAQWDIPKTEMYDEPFHVPRPDAVVFEERWDKGERFRSGCTWDVGKGRVFYFRPGHETYPIFRQPENLRVIENAVRWVAPRAEAKEAHVKPNIIFILADDQGYGDAGAYNPDSKISTPGLDRIAKEGIRFTDAHAGASVCTPTRYGLLTGRYAWRSRLQKGVMVTGENEGCLIDESILTVPELLQEHGYRTAIVGKWHLGYHYEFPEGSGGLRDVVTKKPFGTFTISAAPVGSRIIDGPIAHGFDEFHGFHHAREMHSWAKDDRVVERVPLDQVIARETEAGVRFIEDATKASTPFFLYLALGSPHTPIVPSNPWFGRSGINTYADFVMETDHAVVQILDTLDRLEIADDTLVFFTSDNGCSPEANLDELRKAGHDPSYSLRGMKADVWDGGHRVPYVVRWPGVIAPGRVSDEVICHTNLMATCAELLGATLPVDAGVDSFSILPVLRGETLPTPTYPLVIHHSVGGQFAIRKGDWKFIACKGSGGWSKGGDGRPTQLYDMTADRKESQNLVEREPDVVAELTTLLEAAVENGRTTPGPSQSNDTKVVIWKERSAANTGVPAKR
jgi:arylsulfatase A-like enzyme/trehalose utilization protein